MFSFFTTFNIFKYISLTIFDLKKNVYMCSKITGNPELYIHFYNSQPFIDKNWG